MGISTIDRRGPAHADVPYGPYGCGCRRTRFALKFVSGHVHGIGVIGGIGVAGPHGLQRVRRVPPLTDWLLSREHKSCCSRSCESREGDSDELAPPAMGIDLSLHFFVQFRSADRLVAVAFPPFLEEHSIALPQWIAGLDLRNAFDRISTPQ